jgi:hypothetical protein
MKEIPLVFIQVAFLRTMIAWLNQKYIIFDYRNAPHLISEGYLCEKAFLVFALFAPK